MGIKNHCDKCDAVVREHADVVDVMLESKRIDCTGAIQIRGDIKITFRGHPYMLCDECLESVFGSAKIQFPTVKLLKSLRG